MECKHIKLLNRHVIWSFHRRRRLLSTLQTASIQISRLLKKPPDQEILWLQFRCWILKVNCFLSKHILIVEICGGATVEWYFEQTRNLSSGIFYAERVNTFSVILCIDIWLINSKLYLIGGKGREWQHATKHCYSWKYIPRYCNI